MYRDYKYFMFSILADLINRRGEPIELILDEYGLYEEEKEEFYEWYDNYLNGEILFLGESEL